MKRIKVKGNEVTVYGPCLKEDDYTGPKWCEISINLNRCLIPSSQIEWWTKLSMWPIKFILRIYSERTKPVNGQWFQRLGADHLR